MELTHASPTKRDQGLGVPVSQICALMVLESTAMLLVANSTPIVDFDSILAHVKPGV